ncbi:MAG: YlxR family protein [Clostridia bacterium]|nr:YlxR family protein [Clostridia bacterium]
MEQKAKKIPMRQCLGCNEHFPKRELIRIVRTPEGEVVADTTGKKNGRGAYLCQKISCLRKAQKSKRLERALECAVPDEVLEKIGQELVSEADA